MNKKVFTVRAEFKLDSKSEWINKFRLKYDDPYPFHITLKNPTFVEELALEGLEKQTRIIIKDFHPLNIIFNKYFFGKTDRGHSIMILTKRNNNLLRLQKTIREQLSRYGTHVKPDYEQFEKNFRPHITIGRHLDNRQLKHAKQELGRPVFCRTLIKEVILVIADSLKMENTNRFIKRVVYVLSNPK